LGRGESVANNPYNAFIDTGALLSGYSNKEVNQHLLQRSLQWCGGVVFLDDDDTQQVDGKLLVVW
jgi:hypothetical protein